MSKDCGAEGVIKYTPFLLRGPAVRWASACAVLCAQGRSAAPRPPQRCPWLFPGRAWSHLCFLSTVRGLHWAPLWVRETHRLSSSKSRSAVTAEASRSSTAGVPPAPVPRLRFWETWKLGGAQRGFTECVSCRLFSLSLCSDRNKLHLLYK